MTIGVNEDQNYGPFYTSTGVAGKKVLAVASVQADVTPGSGFQVTLTLDGSSSTVKVAYQLWLFVSIPTMVVNWPIVPISMGTNVTNDACNPLDPQDFSNAIPLVRLGGCDALTKQTNLEAIGARYIIFYRNDTSSGFEDLNSDGSSAYVISKASGEGIVNTYLAGGSATGDFSAAVQVNQPVTDGSGGVPDLYGNWGPLDDLSIKPDIAAPGSNTLSTYLNHGWFTTLYSSEAAAAYTAGIAALYIGQVGGRKTNPKYNATELAMRIISSGSARPFFDYGSNSLTSQLAPVAQVGCGLVNASKVLEYTTSLSFARFELNDTKHFQQSQKVDITNNADVDVIYTFGVLDSIGIEAWNPSQGRIARQEELTFIDGLNAGVNLPSGTFKVSPGETEIAECVLLYHEPGIP